MDFCKCLLVFCWPSCISGEPPFGIVVGRQGGELIGPIADDINEGGKADFYCVADGDPPPLYRWTLANGDPLPSNAQLLGVSGEILRLGNITKTTCVRCIAYNSQGNTSAVQCVDVLGE